jgi:hypothetical protein
MFRFMIRDVLWLTVVVALGLAWWQDHRALSQSELDRADAEEKAGFLLKVLRQDGYDVDAPMGIKGPISLPSHYQIIAEREAGHIVPPEEHRGP